MHLVFENVVFRESEVGQLFLRRGVAEYRRGEEGFGGTEGVFGEQDILDVGESWELALPDQSIRNELLVTFRGKAERRLTD